MLWDNFLTEQLKYVFEDWQVIHECCEKLFNETHNGEELGRRFLLEFEHEQIDRVCEVVGYVMVHPETHELIHDDSKTTEIFQVVLDMLVKDPKECATMNSDKFLARINGLIFNNQDNELLF